jgi:hypothetical protein
MSEPAEVQLPDFAPNAAPLQKKYQNPHPSASPTVQMPHAVFYPPALILPPPPTPPQHSKHCQDACIVSISALVACAIGLTIGLCIGRAYFCVQLRSAMAGVTLSPPKLNILSVSPQRNFGLSSPYKEEPASISDDTFIMTYDAELGRCVETPAKGGLASFRTGALRTPQQYRPQQTPQPVFQTTQQTPQPMFQTT